jgi:hypothetical protein
MKLESWKATVWSDCGLIEAAAAVVEGPFGSVAAAAWNLAVEQEMSGVAPVHSS